MMKNSLVGWLNENRRTRRARCADLAYLEQVDVFVAVIRANDVGRARIRRQRVVESRYVEPISEDRQTVANMMTCEQIEHKRARANTTTTRRRVSSYRVCAARRRGRRGARRSRRAPRRAVASPAPVPDWPTSVRTSERASRE